MAYKRVPITRASKRPLAGVGLWIGWLDAAFFDSQDQATFANPPSQVLTTSTNMLPALVAFAAFKVRSLMTLYNGART